MKTIHVSLRKQGRLAHLVVAAARRLAGNDEITTTVIGRTIFTLLENLPAEVLTHELIHIAQLEEQGRIRWAWRYYVKERTVPYREKSAEVEAYGNQHDPDYLLHRWPDLRLIVEDA